MSPRPVLGKVLALQRYDTANPSALVSAFGVPGTAGARWAREREDWSMTHFSCGDGTDHYFNLDGTYDGWGRGLSPGANQDVAIEIIKQVEQDRKIEDPETWKGIGEDFPLL